ncbi:hypothetical protein ACLOJK_018123 [Asimina triloba]
MGFILFSLSLFSAIINYLIFPPFPFTSNAGIWRFGTGTPLWRNGPPGKPVLCNACGSRWRTKGTLANYAPLHSRFFLPIATNDPRGYRESNSLHNKKTNDLYIVNHAEYATQVGETAPEHSQYDGDFDDGFSNCSSPGSGTSFSESCIQYGSLDGNDISGQVQSHFWCSHIPSRKRTSKKHKSPSPIENLRRDLSDILQQQQSSYPSGSIEDLIFLEQDKDPTLSMETVLGGFPIKKPHQSAEEESVASSFVAESKISCFNDASMGSSSLDMHSRNDEISSSSKYTFKLTRDTNKSKKMKETMTKHYDLANCQTSEGGRLEAQDHSSVHLHPTKVSLETTIDSSSRPRLKDSNDQLLMVCSNPNAAPTSSPKRIFTMPASVNDDSVEMLDKDFFTTSPPRLWFYPEDFSYFPALKKDQD